MENNKIEMILIDYDGVISKNAVPIALNSMYNFMQEFNPIPYESYKTLFKEVIAFPMVETVTFIWKSFGLKDRLPELFKHLSQIGHHNDAKIEIEEDFDAFISYCNNQHIDYRIFSSADKSTGRIQELLKRVGEDKYYNLNNNSKADPNTFEIAAKELGVSLDRIFYIDDSPVALRSGKLKGVNTVMMFNDVFGYDDYSIFKDYVDFAVSSFQELEKIIEANQFIH